MISNQIKKQLNINTLLYKDTVNYTISKAIPGLVGFITIFCFIRLVGKAEYGKYALIFSLANMTAVLFSGWLQQSILRFYTIYESNGILLNRTVLKGIISSTACGILFIGVVFLTRNLIRGNQNISSIVCILSIVLSFCIMVYTISLALFQAKLKTSLIAKTESVRSILVFIFPIFIIYLFVQSFTGLIGGVIAGYVCMLFWIKKQYYNKFFGAIFDKSIDNAQINQLFKIFLKYGFPLSLWLAFMSSFQVIDRFMINYYFDFAETGTYASLYDLTIRSFSLFFFPLVMASHPRIMKLWNEGNYIATKKLINFVLLIQFIIFLFIVIGYVFFADVVLSLLFDHSSGNLKILLGYLAIGGFLWQISLTIHKPLEINKQTWVMVFAIAISIMVHIFINMYFLPKIGINASGIALIFSALSYIMICSLFSFRFLYHQLH